MAHELGTSDRAIIIYRNDNYCRPRWQVFSAGRLVYGPVSRKRAYAYIDLLRASATPINA